MRISLHQFKRQVFLLSLTLSAWGSDFSFFTTMRVGLPTALSWELGAGSTAATTQSNVNYEWNSANGSTTWRPGGLAQSFEIGYNRTTNTGFVTVFNSSNNAVTASYANPGAAPATNTLWTLPAANFFASANTSFLPGSVTVENLAFTPGVQVLSGSLPTSIGAANPGNGVTNTNNLSTPIVFDASANGGSWTIAGTIRMSGIFPVSGTAVGNNLQFGLGAVGTETPEASTISLFAVGLASLIVAGKFKRA
jgi:hypothetical protein